jgi:LPXTG-motif cell wall-anchored protein
MAKYYTTALGLKSSETQCCADALEKIIGDLPDGSELVLGRGRWFLSRRLQISGKKNFTLNGELIPFIPDEEACQLLAPTVIEVKKGAESAGLPEKLPLYYNTGKTSDVAVQWITDGLDLNTAGEYLVFASANGMRAGVTVKVVADDPVDPPVEPPIDPPSAGDGTVFFLLVAVLSMGGLILLVSKKRRNA